MKAQYFPLKPRISVRFLTAIFLLVFSNTVFAQIPTNLFSSLYNIPISFNYPSETKTISVFPDYVLSYYENYTIEPTPYPHSVVHGHFVFLDYSYPIGYYYDFELPEEIHVTDFVQPSSSNFIVFCGYSIKPENQYSYRGVIGWFDLTTGTSSLSYIDVNEISKFKRVEAYVEDDEYHIVAIGVTVNVPINGIFHMKGPDYIQNNFSYDIYPVVSGNILWDIVVTRNYVTFVGYDHVLDGICLRRELRGSMDTPNELNNIYAFPFGDDTMTATVHAAYMGNRLNRTGDMVAICNPCVVIGGGTRCYSRFIDVSTLTMTNAQMFKLPDKVGLQEITYVNDPGLLCLLGTDHPYGGPLCSPVFLLEPAVTTSYNATFFYDTKYFHNHIDRINNSLVSVKHVVIGGPKYWYEKRVDYPTNGCNVVDSIGVYRVPPTTFISLQDPLSGVSAGAAYPQDKNKVIFDTITPDCYSIIPR